MAKQAYFDTFNAPIAPLGIVALSSCKELADSVNSYIKSFRQKDTRVEAGFASESGYVKDSYLIANETPRFRSGEGKGAINESVRGKDLYILVDVCNHSMSYEMFGFTNYMTPDDHFQDLKRIIGSVAGKARRICVIMPFLYESRQHKRTHRESLDCALALQELVQMGVSTIITFDAHDPRVQNAIPLLGFDTVTTSYQFVKGLYTAVPDLELSPKNAMVISPDEGGSGRAIYLANMLGVDMGMFYKRRDYTRIVNGSNPILEHEFLGSNVEGKDVFVLDDMISSGDSVIDVAKQLKKLKAKRIFILSTFGLFTNGMEKFDKAYEEGLFDFLLTTNLIYQDPVLFEKPYYISCDMSKYLALIIDSLNHDGSISELLNPADRIHSFINKKIQELGEAELSEAGIKLPEKEEEDE